MSYFFHLILVVATLLWVVSPLLWVVANLLWVVSPLLWVVWVASLVVVATSLGWVHRALLGQHLGGQGRLAKLIRKEGIPMVLAW